MSFRFLKKKDGSKILQQYSHSKMEYEEVPEVAEETNLERVRKELIRVSCLPKYRGEKFSLIISKVFFECIKLELYGTLASLDRNQSFSLYGVNFYVVNHISNDFKVILEFEN